MKIKILVVILLLCVLTIIFSGIKINQAFNPEPTICYDGQKKEFIYYNIKDEDLFTDLKELMPGDIKEQEITIKAQNINCNTKLFINFSKSDEEFDNTNVLNYVKIFANDKELIKTKEFIEIADFKSDYETKINVVVSIPKEASNEIADIKYNMEWEILVQEEAGQIVHNPKTYDSTNIYLYITLIIISFVIMIYTIKSIYNSF